MRNMWHDRVVLTLTAGCRSSLHVAVWPRLGGTVLGGICCLSGWRLYWCCCSECCAWQVKWSGVLEVAATHKCCMSCAVCRFEDLTLGEYSCHGGTRCVLLAT